MKRIAKRIMVTFLAIAMSVGMITMPVQAKTKITGKTVEVTNHFGDSRSFGTYDTRGDADANPITVYAEDNEFPFTVIISSAEGSTNKYSFDSYGVKYVKDTWWPLFGSYHETYATIDIEPYPPTPTSNTTRSTQTQKAPTEDEILDEKLDQLLDELRLDFCYVESTPYAKELRAFLAGEWDGSIRRDENAEDAYAGYISSRQVFHRSYQWHATNLYSGEFASKEVNVDYIGYLEVITPATDQQDFSFAVSRRDKTFEQWRFLEKLDSWTLPSDAGVIDNIVLLGGEENNPDKCQAIVMTTDAEGEEHIYSLLSGGVVKKSI